MFDFAIRLRSTKLLILRAYSLSEKQAWMHALQVLPSLPYRLHSALSAPLDLCRRRQRSVFAAALTRVPALPV
eukprot:SAG31_NODE_32840_length_351_cov_0.611111_1_plen_72_part_10